MVRSDTFVTRRVPCTTVCFPEPFLGAFTIHSMQISRLNPETLLRPDAAVQRCLCKKCALRIHLDRTSKVLHRHSELLDRLLWSKVNYLGFQ